MISAIKGKIAGFNASSVIIDTGALEYEVFIPLNVFASLQRLSNDDAVFLHIYHHFSENEQRLFGFTEKSQRDLFTSLRLIKGIGTGLALSMLSHLDTRLLLRICENRDVQSLCRIPKIGKTTAETIIFEINRKRDRWEKLLKQSEEANTATGAPLPDPVDSERDLALLALIQLGYKEKEARDALSKISQKENSKELHAAEIIKEALRLL